MSKSLSGFVPHEEVCPRCEKPFWKDVVARKYCSSKCKCKANYIRHKPEKAYFVCNVCRKKTVREFEGQERCTRKICLKKDEIVATEATVVNGMRKEFNLRPIEPTRMKCLRCDRPFDSWDKVLNKMCPECKKVRV